MSRSCNSPCPRRSVRFHPGFEVLEDRCVPAVGVNQVGTEIIVSGDGKVNKIVVTDNGTNDPDNITVKIGKNSQTFDGPITAIKIATEGRKDHVTFKTTGDFQAGVVRLVDVALGAQNDKFHASLGGDVLAGAQLTLDVHGGGKNDKASVSATSDVDVAVGGLLRVNMFGTSGHDRIRFDYQGELDGQLFMNLDGGGHKDHVAAVVTEDAGSDNQPGDAADKARVLGGDDKDKLTFHLNLPTPVGGTNFTLLDGGAAKDKCADTNIAEVLNCP